MKWICENKDCGKPLNIDVYFFGLDDDILCRECNKKREKEN